MSSFPGGLLEPVLGPFENGFMRRALVEVVLAAALCGLLGVHVLLRRLAFYAVAVSHIALPGMVFASLAGLNVYVGGGAAAVAAAGVVGRVDGGGRIHEASAIGVVTAGATGLGVLALSARSGFSRDISGYLTGQVLAVTTADILLTAVVAAVVMGFLFTFHKELVMSAFDRDGARAMGYPLRTLDAALLAAVAAALVAALPSTGTVLCVGLIAAPAAAARRMTSDIPAMIATSIGVAVGCGVTGLLVSYHLRTAPGATITLVAASVFGLTLVPFAWLGAAVTARGFPIGRPGRSASAHDPPDRPEQ